ncbi:glycosyltransferase [Rubripirellula amarantea]|nr:glycosyltransferase [Rubripirellula amarantea]
MTTSSSLCRPLAIHYRREAYSETLAVAGQQQAGRPQGLMGREVASQSFLNALLKYGSWSILETLIESESDRTSLQEACARELSQHSTPRRVRVTPMRELRQWLRGEKDQPRHSAAMPTPAATKLIVGGPAANVLHFANPPEPRFAWARQRYAPHSVAFSGVTHTLCSPLGLDVLWQLMSAPMYSYDRLISTSAAVTRMLRDTTGVMSEYLSGITGGKASAGFTIEQLPLGVDTDQHRVATAGQRSDARRRLGIGVGDDDIVLLFVGRLSHHAKSHPFPMYIAAQRAAMAHPNRQIHVALCGWFSNDAIRKAFVDSAAQFAPNVRLHLVNGLDAWWRDHVWEAADVFVSLADSIQETFGLTNLEAMSRGIPVVATDWNGYRDTVVHGQTGFLVPTLMVPDACADATARVITGEISYDQFLGEVGQTVVVSIPDAIAAIDSLVADDGLRRRMGQAGRERVENRFDWQIIIALYEAMWHRQREERVLHQQASLRVSEMGVDIPNANTNANVSTEPSSSHRTVAVQSGVGFPISRCPAIYPPIDLVFAGYPTTWIADEAVLQCAADAAVSLSQATSNSLLNYCAGERLTDMAIVEKMLASTQQSPLQVVDLISHVTRWLDMGRNENSSPIRATIAWMLKYGLLNVVTPASADHFSGEHLSGGHSKKILSFVTTCKGRLSDLKETLPRMIAQPHSEVIVVDYSCPERSGDWVAEHYPTVKVVRVPGKEAFDRSDAKNRGVAASSAPWVCLIDGDVELEPEFVDAVSAMLEPGCFFRSSQPGEGTGGTFVVAREDFDRVGGHDPVFQGWGEEDDDLIDALKFIGLQTRRYSAALIRHRDHDDDARTQFHQDSDRRHSHMINRIYRCGKWDLARLSGVVAPQNRRQAVYDLVSDEVRKLIGQGLPGKVRIDTGSMRWTPMASHSRRVLEYTITPTNEDVAGDYEPSFQASALKKQSE